jgi:putative oxidoreductase
MVNSNAANLGLLALRVVIGVTMFAHGFNHVWRGGKIPGTGRWFESLGMKPGWLHAWLASLTELIFGVLLAVGLLTPLAAGACAGVMIVAWITNHLKNGFFIFRPGEGYEYVMNLAVASLALAFIGAGEWSLDHAFGLDDTFDGWVGGLIGLVVGVGGSLDFAHPMTVPSLAAIACVSESTFIRAFKATFGETPHRYLQRRRIERATFLLRTTDTSVTDVCMQCGFSSLGTFSRTFKDIVGESPSEFQQRGTVAAEVPTCFVRAWTRPSSFGEVPTTPPPVR